MEEGSSGHKRPKSSGVAGGSRKRRRVDPPVDHLFRVDGVPTLLDLAAKVTAEHVAFQSMEERYSHIPEPVQQRVLFWSFPREEQRIRMYSSSARVSDDDHDDDEKSSSAVSPFHEGVRLLDQQGVEDALQIGFHLSGVVRSSAVIDGVRKPFNVSVSFDRCKITSVKCSCDTRDIHWCQHVVALTLYRIRFPDQVRLRLPISETLHQMDRDQLQKLVQYLIAEHHTQVLPTTQRLAEEILQKSSDINRIPGAPDPTAYAEGGHSWYLDEGQVCALVRTYLGQNSGCEQIQLLFAKVREMLKRNDENGPRLLQLLSEQFLTYKNPWATTPLRPVPPVLSERMQNMWDQLGALWVCVVLNPYGKSCSKQRWTELLKKWISLSTCPPETCASGQLDAVLYGRVDDKPKRTVFTRALEASQIEWTDDQLKWIANDDRSIPPALTTGDTSATVNEQGQSMWDEHVPMACARVDSLRAHGYKKQALALAVSVARTIKHAQATATPSDQSSQQEGWICHPLDPINCLFDTLWSAGSKQKQSIDVPCTSKELLIRRPKDSLDQTESYSALALEVALIALSQRRKRPNCSYAKQKTVKQEQKLIAKIKALTLDDNLMAVVMRQAHLLLSGNWSGLTGLLTQPAPVHTVACHLFESLLEKNAELAYQVGLTAMRAPVVDGQDRDDGAFIISHPIAWNAISFNHCEHQQSELARSMLLASKDDVNRLRQVLETVHGYMRSSLLVYRLAHEIHQAATSHSEASISRRNLINAALELGLQVLRMTVGSPTWWPRREMVRWLVNCASSLNLAALLSVLTNWSQLFTPAEACGTVAQLILADTVTLQLKLDGTEQQQLMRSIHAVAVQCVDKDPASCALHALMLCENDVAVFENCYYLVKARASMAMPPQEIFSIARYMEQRGHRQKAYEMALLGLQKTHIGYGEEASPLTQDVYWACGLCDRMERLSSDTSVDLRASPLANVMHHIIMNVKCATVLSTILRGYALGAAGFAKNPCWIEDQSNGKRTGVTSTELPFEKPPLKGLLEAALDAFRHTADGRLHHISPRHYNEFLEFLSKARDTYLLAPGGHQRFHHLLTAMKQRFKGKKKLMALIAHRFQV